MPTLRKATTFLAMFLAIVGAVAIGDDSGDPYMRPEVVEHIRYVRDLLFNGQYRFCMSECDRLEREYPDLLVWRFAAMLAPQARMLELHDYSLEKQYMTEWRKMEKLYIKVAAERPLYVYDHLCIGGGYGIYGLHHARNRDFRKAFSVGVKALQELGRARDADPLCDDVYLGYGIYHYYRGSLSSRIKWLPFFVGEKQQGLDELERARGGIFGEPLVDSALMYLYKDEGKWKEGLAIASDMAKRYPKSLLLVQHLGIFRLMLDEYEPALAEFDEVLKADPRNGPVRFYRGMTLWKLGRLDEGEGECKLCLKLTDSTIYLAAAYWVLGEIAWERGNKAGAETMWRKALELEPDMPEPAESLERSSMENRP